MQGDILGKNQECPKKNQCLGGCSSQRRECSEALHEKMWINGHASEDREEWMEELKAHCVRCHDDKDETSDHC